MPIQIVPLGDNHLGQVITHYLRPGFEVPDPDEVKKRQQEIGVNVYKISSTIAVKHSLKLKFGEAKNMLFVEQNTTIPVPKVYAVYSQLELADDYPKGSSKPKEYAWHTYIFMDLVAGITVEDAFDTWDEATRANVQNELKDYIRQLRGLPGGDYIGTLDRGPITDVIMRYQGDDLGPFDSEEEFNLALRKTYVKGYNKEPHISDRLDSMLAAHKHKICFTHNDLHVSNVMVNNGHISALIDWADAGWYPDYWEYQAAERTFNPREDWNLILDKAIGRPHCEVLMITKLRVVLL